MVYCQYNDHVPHAEFLLKVCDIIIAHRYMEPGNEFSPALLETRNLFLTGCNILVEFFHYLSGQEVILHG